MSSVGPREEGALGSLRAQGGGGESEIRGSLTSGLSLVSRVFIKESPFSAFQRTKVGKECAGAPEYLRLTPCVAIRRLGLHPTVKRGDPKRGLMSVSSARVASEDFSEGTGKASAG